MQCALMVREEWTFTFRLGQPACVRGPGDPWGPQSMWAYASWRDGLVQNQQNKEQACMDQSFTRLPSLQLRQLNPPSTWLHGLPGQIHECASWNSPQLLPARLASYAPSPPGKALCSLPPAWTPPCPQPASHWALLFPSFLVLRFIC